MPIDAEFASLSHKDPFVVCFVRPHSFRWPKFLANCSLIFGIRKRITEHFKLIFGAHTKKDEFAAGRFQRFTDLSICFSSGKTFDRKTR